MGGEGGVISAAVLHVKDQHKIQNPGFQLRIVAVGPENVKDILRRGKAGHRGMDEKAVSVMVMAVGLIAVDAQDREKSDELDALAQHVGKGGIVRPVVVGIKSEDASGQRIHHILAGGF